VMHRWDLIPIAAILAVTGMIIMVVAIISIARAIGKRGVTRKELGELRRDISQMKDHINDIREQLADIIIRLG
jgi:hypothetical protein